MIKKLHLTILSLFVSFSVTLAINDSTEFNIANKYHRGYDLIYGLNYDLMNSSVNSRTAGKLIIDAYYRGIEPSIKNNTIKNITGFIWSFATTWSSTMWPHEFGHFLRANEVGGDFRIEKVRFPIAFGKVEFPDDATLVDESMFITGGLEVNHLIANEIQKDYYNYNGLHNDELYTAFFHRVMYPAYTMLFVRIDPKKSENWVNDAGESVCMGDAACFAKLVWERRGNNAINPDGKVSQGLVDLYNHAAWFSVLWNLADINLYHQASALTKGELNGRRPKYLIGNETNGWSYGTLFNASVLGVELYLNNYIRLKDKFYTAYLKYGFPFENYGVGISAYNIFNTKSVVADLNFDFWNQEFYDLGLHGSTNLSFLIGKKFYLSSQLGWKTEGYLLGKSINKGLVGQMGLRYVL